MRIDIKFPDGVAKDFEFPVMGSCMLASAENPSMYALYEQRNGQENLQDLETIRNNFNLKRLF